MRSLLQLALLTTLLGAPLAPAQLLGPPPIPPPQNPGRHKSKETRADVEWLWQYSPPPAGGRQHELLEDPHFLPFLAQYLTAPQSFWGPAPTDPQNPTHKSLAQTAYDFLALPGEVLADDNRYITVTGHVFHFPTSRGLLFVDLNDPHPNVVFAAIDWIRDSKPISDPEAQYTLWIFPTRPLGTPQAPNQLPTPFQRSLVRWMKTPLPGSKIVENITAAIEVLPDGTPHQIPVPNEHTL